jgi:hypothetical protein
MAAMAVWSSRTLRNEQLQLTCPKDFSWFEFSESLCERLEIIAERPSPL